MDPDHAVKGPHIDTQKPPKTKALAKKRSHLKRRPAQVAYFLLHHCLDPVGHSGPLGFWPPPMHSLTSIHFPGAPHLSLPQPSRSFRPTRFLAQPRGVARAARNLTAEEPARHGMSHLIFFELAETSSQAAAAAHPGCQTVSRPAVPQLSRNPALKGQQVQAPNMLRSLLGTLERPGPQRLMSGLEDRLSCM